VCLETGERLDYFIKHCGLLNIDRTGWTGNLPETNSIMGFVLNNDLRIDGPIVQNGKVML